MRLFISTLSIALLAVSCKKEDAIKPQAATPTYYQYSGKIAPGTGASIILQDGKLLHCGTSAAQKLVVVKTDQQGNSIWQKEFANDDNAIITSAIETANGDILVCGSDDAGKLLMKLDANGNVLFRKTIQQGRAYKTIRSRDDNFYVLGTHNASAMVLKINADGDSLWQGNTDFNTGGNDNPIDIVACGSGDVLVMGTVSSPSQVVLAKTNDYGGPQFQTTVSTSNEIYDNTYPSQSVELAEGAFITCITTQTPIAQSFIVKHNILGQEAWRKDLPYNYETPGQYMAMAANSDGGFTVAGCTDGNKLFAVRYNANGNIMWQQQYNDERSKEVRTLLYDARNNAYIITGNIGAAQFFTFRIHPATGKPM